MRKFYLIMCFCCLVAHQAMPQYAEIYASSHKQTPSEIFRVDSQSLKDGLSQLESRYNISIAYKDELVEGKNVNQSLNSYRSSDDALKSLLRETGLNYEKVSERFYVIFPKQSGRNKEKSQLTASVSSLYSFTTPSLQFKPYSILMPGNGQNTETAIRVTGKVVDENGSGFPGVNILVKGTSTGTTTDVNGGYNLTVDDENSTLVFSFVGYTTQEIPLQGRSSVNLTMIVDAKALEEVVVTALGIEKSAKSIGYATTKVTSDQLSVNRSVNVMGTLQGKVAGLNISTLGTGPGGSSKIRLRGQSSFSGQNTPLIVINGVPIDNTNFGTNLGNNAGDASVATRGGGASTDGGDGLSSINPDDIESMQVLKGGTAAALYGSRAKDGVIMITTKSRGTTRGIGVSYNMNYTNEKVLDYTDYQYKYGQGENGAGPSSPGASPNPTSGQWSFGPKITPGATQLLFQNTTVPYVAQKGILNQFYRNGQNLTNSVSISANSDKGGMNISFADLSSKGVTPNNEYSRKTANLGFGYDLSSKLSVKGNINYSFERNTNPPVVADQDNSIPTSLFAMANTMPLSVLDANKFNAGGGEYLYSRFANRTNPYWVLSQVKQNIRRDRVFGNFSAKYDITNWLSAQIRGGEDFWTRDQDYINLPTGKASISSGSINSAVAGFYNGLYTQDARRFRETNIDFLVTGAKTFSDFGVNLSVGGNQMRRRSDLNSVQVTDFVVKDLYTVQNGRAKDPLYDLQERGVNSLYGSAEVNYKQMLYLSATLRNDWFSTLSPANRSILYPSLSASYVFSESLGTLPKWLNFGKFRAAYAKVGSDSDVGPYANQLLYGVNGTLFGGQAVGNLPTRVPNANLKPMTVEETELGLELKMLDNKVNLDLAVYKKITTDQIVNAQISDASGFLDTRINSGKSQNKGIELMLNVVPVRNTNFQWDLTFAGAYNITKVLSILTDVPGENITVGSHVFNGFVQQIVGQELGQIVGYGYLRDDGSINPDHKGMIVFGANGLPQRTPGLIPFGSALPKWVGGITNSFSYKGINASFLIDFKLGGKVLSGTNFNAYRHGLSKETLPGREGGVLDANGNDPGNVVGVGVNAASEINTVGAKAEDYYSVVRGSQLIEPVIYNAGYWKLRQITIGYDFTKFFKSTSPIKGVRLNFVANNVLMLKKWVPNIDPESFGYSSDNVVGMESPGVPTTRSLGFNLNVKF